MNETLSQLGVGAILCVMVLRLVFDFLSKNGQSKNGRNGKYVAKDDFRELKDHVQYKSTCEEIVKRVEDKFNIQHGLLKDIKKMLVDNKNN